MTPYEELFENNRKWAERWKRDDPEYFVKLAREQSPEYLYIGCSDSRVPANEIVGLDPGEVFVHRNIANVVNGIDLNVMSVINYAVVHLHVQRIIVCGHYNCGGVKAALEPKDMGLLNPWLRSIRDVYRLHHVELDAIADMNARYNRLVELNTIEQCINVIKVAEVQRSYVTKGYPLVHGWVFEMSTGRIVDLNIDFEERLHAIQNIYNLTGVGWFD